MSIPAEPLRRDLALESLKLTELVSMIKVTVHVHKDSRQDQILEDMLETKGIHPV